MGCHTWFYKKVDRTLEEAIKLAREKISADIELLKQAKNLEYEGSITVLNSFIENIDKGIYIFKAPLYYDSGWLEPTGEEEEEVTNIWEHQPESLCEFIEGKGFYVECGDFHDIFRVGMYPEDKLFSKQECLDFVESKYIKLTTDQLEELNAFWNKYPEGMIEFD